MSRIATLALLCLIAASSSVQAAPSTSAAPIYPIIVKEQAAVDSALLRERLTARRQLNLDRLHAYALAGQFPINDVRPGMLNIFIDDEGHICAAANLIHLDGHKDLVKSTAKKSNYIVLAQVKQGPLMNWMLTSGFTQEEIALIQEPYFFDDRVIEPAPAPQPKLTKREIEVARVRGVLLAVHKQLSANSKKSLDLLAERLQSHRMLAISFTAPAVRQFAVAP